MNKRDVIIGLIVLFALVLAVVIVIRRARPAPTPMASPTPTSTFRENIERTFNVQIPKTAETADLRDVTGGNGEGIATREVENGMNVYTILANMENPASGSFYQGWLVRGKPGDSNYSVLSLGKLHIAKGGWLVEFQSTTNYSDYKNVLVTLETKTTSIPGKHILEGSF